MLNCLELFTISLFINFMDNLDAKWTFFPVRIVDNITQYFHTIKLPTATGNFDNNCKLQQW